MYYQKSEKLTVDRISWESYTGKSDNEKGSDLWKYKILIEHENNGYTWLNEMQKLCSIKAPYKLIVTYGRRFNGESENVTQDGKGVKLLEKAEELLHYIGEYHSEEFYLMFGEENNNLNSKSGEEINNIYDIYKLNRDGKFELVNKNDDNSSWADPKRLKK